MRIALLSDIHGNLEALTAVLADIKLQDIDKVHSLGDVVGYGCNPIECIELVEQSCDIKLMGNHEFLALGLADEKKYNPAALESINWTREKLGDYDISLLENYQMDASDGDFYFVHASPFNPSEWNYILNLNQAEKAFENLRQRVCFCGHSHVPMIFLENPEGPPRQKAGHDILMDPDYRYIINVGSTGQPRDNDPRACYVIVDSKTNDLSYRRVEYDYKFTQEKMADASIPDVLIKRLEIGR
ncbi:MAG: metallophosphoesterase family protein [bacterium]|nr:metallophosphoesterase family protein [bacterium]